MSKSEETFMKKIILTLLLLMAVPGLVMAHSGRTDKNGCHKDKTTGTRHCH
jgi:hypothetical protein